MKYRTLLYLAALLLSLPVTAATQPASAAPTLPPALTKRLAPPPVLQEKTDLPCLRCDGSGHIHRLASQDLKRVGRRERESTHRITKRRLLSTCPVCNGAGHCVRAYTNSEKLPAIKLMRHAYDEAQLKAGRIPVGAAYADRSAMETLSPEDQARLAHQYPKICTTCFGLGKICCRRCDGLGFKPGEVDRETGIKEPNEPCSTCKTLGETVCKRCDGSGLARICSSCDGTGLRQKRDRNAPSGYKTVLCTSCDGAGRR